MGITRMGNSWTLSEQRGSVNGRWRQRDHRAGLRGNSRRRLYVLRSVQETDCLKDHIWRPPPPSTLPHSHIITCIGCFLATPSPSYCRRTMWPVHDRTTNAFQRARRGVMQHHESTGWTNDNMRRWRREQTAGFL